MSEPPLIRRATPDDADAYVRIMGELAVFSGLMQLPYPSVGFWREKLANTAGSTSIDVSLVAELDGVVVGSAGVHPVGPAVRRRHCAMLGISVLPESQRRGVGSALMQAICDYADNWAHILRLELGVYVDNAPAIALYKKFGFEIEGTNRAYALRNGVYVDSYFMARLHPQPPQLPMRNPQ